jgi:DNA-binding response OmpR family regulator
MLPDKPNAADGNRGAIEHMDAPAGTLRVLVIEDESMVAMLIEDMLREMGHQAGAIATRMADARREAETGSFDFAIVDVSLQGEPSYAIANILRARGIPFVFATGHDATGLDPGYGAALALQKPFRSEDLRAALSLVMASR